tara:strand:+ start:910 stop:1314 length:405 start_codon:yes stop_codon:yes gene_type:complete
MKRFAPITTALVASLLLSPPVQPSELTSKELMKFDRDAWFKAGIFLGRMQSLCLAGNSQLVDPRKIPDMLAALISSHEQVTLQDDSPHRIDELAIFVLNKHNPECIKFLPLKFQGPPKPALPDQLNLGPQFANP